MACITNDLKSSSRPLVPVICFVFFSHAVIHLSTRVPSTQKRIDAMDIYTCTYFCMSVAGCFRVFLGVGPNWAFLPSGSVSHHRQIRCVTRARSLRVFDNRAQWTAKQNGGKREGGGETISFQVRV